MNFNVIATEPFERKLKRLIRKYPSLSNELAVVINKLQSNPSFVSPLGMNCYKIRIAISSKGKGIKIFNWNAWSRLNIINENNF